MHGTARVPADSCTYTEVETAATVDGAAGAAAGGGGATEVATFSAEEKRECSRLGRPPTAMPAGGSAGEDRGQKGDWFACEAAMSLGQPPTHFRPRPQCWAPDMAGDKTKQASRVVFQSSLPRL
jgi:hypothetical protein